MQGTGLAFIAFTEAMTHFPASPFWSVMFFLMLINLGLGSMIGTMAGITTPIIDTFKVPKEMFTGTSWQPPPPVGVTGCGSDGETLGSDSFLTHRAGPAAGWAVGLGSGRWGGLGAPRSPGPAHRTPAPTPASGSL